MYTDFYFYISMITISTQRHKKDYLDNSACFLKGT